MYKLIGCLLVINAFVLTAAWVLADHQYKSWAITICVIVMFFGIFLSVQDRVEEVTLEGVGTIKAASEKATADAEAIRALRERIEAQGATVDLVAQQATRAGRQVEEMRVGTEFTHTIVAAQNDDRRAYDQLRDWANDATFPMREAAAAAYRTIMDQHAPGIVRTGFKVDWAPGVDPATISIDAFWQTYNSAPTWGKKALIEYIWKREDIPALDRAGILAKILETDSSLEACEYAGRFLATHLGLELKPLAIEPILRAWRAKELLINPAIRSDRHDI